MSETEDEKKKAHTHFFDVERFRRVVSQGSKPLGRWGKVSRKITVAYDSMQSFFFMMILGMLTFGVLLVVVFGATLGPIGFLGIMAVIIGGLGFFAEKRLGKSAQFGDYSVVRRTLATAAAFGLVLLFLFILISISRI